MGVKMTVSCKHCGADIPEDDWGPDGAVEDGAIDELVIHQFDPEEPAVAVFQHDYYCDPECAAAAFGGKDDE